MKKLLLLFLTLFILFPCRAYSQQLVNGSNGKNQTFIQDTSEEVLVKSFRNKMDNSETVMDAQVISMESKWRNFKNDLYFGNRREIYTVITFKVFHWIKGSMRGNEVTFYVPGGKIGDNVVMVSIAPIYNLNLRAIFFLGNKEPNTYILDEGRVPIFGGENGRRGGINVGTWQVDPGNYIKIVKQAVTDTTAYPKYIHMLKMADEERLRWKNGLWNSDSVHLHHRAMLEQMRRAHADTTKGGVK